MDNKIEILMLEKDITIDNIYTMDDKDFKTSKNIFDCKFDGDLVSMKYIEKEESSATCLLKVLDKTVRNEFLHTGNYVWIKVDGIDLIKGKVARVGLDKRGESAVLELFIKSYTDFGVEPYLEQGKVKTRQLVESEVEKTSDGAIDELKVKERNVSSIAIHYKRKGEKITNENKEVRFKERAYRYSTVAKAVLERNKKNKNSILGYYVEKSEKEEDEDSVYFNDVDGSNRIITQKANESDFAFLTRLAKEIDFMFFIRNGWAFFIKSSHLDFPEYTFFTDGSNDNVFQLIEFNPISVDEGKGYSLFQGDVDLFEKKVEANIDIRCELDNE